MAIITGEYNIDDLFPNGEKVFGRKEIVYNLFLVSVIFCCHIVLMNVFTGLAVGDVATAMRIVFITSALVTKALSWLPQLTSVDVLQWKSPVWGPLPRLTNYLNVKSEAVQIKARYQMKLAANMRKHYWLFDFLKSSSKICESSDRNTLKIKIVNSGMLTYSKMLTWSKRPQIVNIKRRISYMDPI